MNRLKLLVFSSFAVSFLFLTFPAKTLAQELPTIGANLGAYIPPSGNECNINVPSQYSTIQAGINAANFGDTVCVGPGTYNEDLNINKSIRLSGSGINQSFIYGQDSSFDHPASIIISNNNIVIEGFTIYGAGTTYNNPAVRIQRFLSGITIRYNRMVSGNGALSLVVNGPSSNDLIQNNILEGTNSYEVLQIGGDNVNVLNNTFTGTVQLTDRGDSGVVFLTQATNSLIQRNVFNTGGTVYELVILSYSSNMVNENNMNSSTNRKLRVSGGNPTFLNAENNWWNVAGNDPSAYVIGDVDYTPFALSPFPEYQLPNLAPFVRSISGTTINEGHAYGINGSFSDPASTSWTATVNYGDGSGVQPLALSGTNFSLNHIYKDNGTYTVTVSVTDDQNATGTVTATVTVNNLVPTIGAITAPSTPVQVNTAITASASFTDSGTLDTHVASWDWGDGNITSGTVTESNGSGSVSDSHTYTLASVYTITLTVVDKDNGIGTQIFQYVSVYNPTPQGLFAGNRIFSSLAGAYPQNPNLTGQVQFGVTSKYQDTSLIGNVSMNFRAANLEFDSTSLTVLVTSNGMATLRGTGTINGSGNYNFLVTGLDATQDAIRFQIKDQSGSVIYDSQPGVADTATPTTPVTGQIIVH